MNATAILDDNNKITLPRDIRDRYFLEPGDELAISDNGDGSVLLDLAPSQTLADLRAAFDRNLPEKTSGPVDVKEEIENYLEDKHKIARH